MLKIVIPSVHQSHKYDQLTIVGEADGDNEGEMVGDCREPMMNQQWHSLVQSYCCNKKNMLTDITSVGGSDGGSEGERVGSEVGASEGLADGCNVGFLVGRRVGRLVGELVGESVLLN